MLGVELLQWLIGRRQRYRVTGMSMTPTLSPGDHLLVDTHAYDEGLPAVGDIVVARHPRTEDVIITKRVTGCDGDQVWLGSDNGQAGADSRHFGPVAPALLLGRVTAALGS